MTSHVANLNAHTLVSVFDDFETAKRVFENLRSQGFTGDKIELVTHSLRAECPEVETPKVHETTSSVLEKGAVQGAGIGLGLGAGFGVAAAALTASPGMAVGAMIYAGLAGALVGGIGGADKADLDDTVNLPTIDEYQRLLDEGHSLVVLYGSHEELQRAENFVKSIPDAESHLRRLNGHLFHEHPSCPQFNRGGQDVFDPST